MRNNPRMRPQLEEYLEQHTKTPPSTSHYEQNVIFCYN